MVSCRSVYCPIEGTKSYFYFPHNQFGLTLPFSLLDQPVMMVPCYRFRRYVGFRPERLNNLREISMYPLIHSRSKSLNLQTKSRVIVVTYRLCPSSRTEKHNFQRLAELPPPSREVQGRTYLDKPLSTRYSVGI